jgi:DNA-binding response OmpR family regulator
MFMKGKQVGRVSAETASCKLSLKGGVRMRILVVEDDPRLGPNLKKGLEKHHYAVDLVTDGEDGVLMGSTVPYDLIVLDVLLPQLNGFEVCRQLRDRKRTMPILLLTALSKVDHRVTGLDTGADDYLTKPFAFRELEARVRALLRRESATKTVELRFMDITLDTGTHEARRGERIIALNSREYTLLEYLMRHPRQVLSREMIAEHVWDCGAEHLSNVIDVYIRYLRRKLCEQQEPDVIHTIRGSGYQLKEPVS